MKEINQVTFNAGSLAAPLKTGMQKTGLSKAETSFDSYLDMGKSTTVTVKSGNDAVQTPDKGQQVTGSTQQADGTVAGTVKADATGESQTGMDKTQPADGDAQADTPEEAGMVDATGEAVDETAGTAALVQAVAGAVKEIVQDITGVDGEMLDDILATLGMSVTDLLDTDNLKQFVLFINGQADAMTLLTDESMMAQFESIAGALSDINWEELAGMPKEDLIQLLQDAAGKGFVLDNGGSAEEPQVQDLNTRQQGTAGKGNDIPVIIEYDTVSDGTAGTQQTEDAAKSGTVVKETAGGSSDALDSGTAEETPVQAGKDSKDSSAAGQQGSFNQEKQGQAGDFNQGIQEQPSGTSESVQYEAKNQTVHSEVINGTADFLQNLSQAVADKAGNTAPQQANLQQMIDIVNQVVEQIKVTMGRETTSMQLQLNPESLGKVLISVTTNHGVMTANFTVQSEEAKEALQSQMYSLREALETRELKVDSVEVEVSDFAFSQGSQSGNNDQKEFDKGNGRRFRFDTSDDDRDEEGIAAAQERRRPARLDMGNSIDFTA